MYQERKKLSFEILISNLFSNFGGLILTNLFFAVPFFGSVALAVFLYKNVLQIVPLIVAVVFIISAPFYAGVVRVTRDLSQGIKVNGLFKVFFKAVKENGLRFLLLGVVSYIAVLGCYFGIGVYSAMAANFSSVFYVLLFFVVLFSVFFLFFFYAAPLMTVSFELKLKDICKNSALMTFGEFKKNFFSTIGIIAFLAVSLFPIIVLLYLQSLITAAVAKVLLIAYVIIAFGCLIPACCSLIINHYLYPNMKEVISGNVDKVVMAEGAPEIKEKSTYTESYKEKTTPTPVNLEELKKGDGDEYIFYQGKMIKRKILINQLEKENDYE